MTMQNTYAGASWLETAYIIDMVALESEGRMALGLADGRVIWRLLDRPETMLAEDQAHSGLSALRAGFAEGQLISAGEDGRVLKFDGTEKKELITLGKAWLEQMALYPDDGLIAASYKKNAVILNSEGEKLAEFSDHPSAITGLCFDAKGKRLALSHYNGASLWWVNGEASQKPHRLMWKGSHLGINWSPNGKYLLSVMQENALHGWRLPDFGDFAMSGYALKPKSLSWDKGSRWLASSGSAGIVCWDCGGKGPMGKPATLLGEDCQDVTVKVACHPELPLVAAGTANGMVYVAQFGDERIVWMKTQSASEITSLVWSASGQYLLAGCENGQAYVWQFT